MIRFVEHYFDNINGIATYPIVAIILFFLVFSIMLIIVISIPKNIIKEYENLPLDSEKIKKQ